ncbi:MAG: OmpA family protein [Pseudomonadales bacterium]
MTPTPLNNVTGAVLATQLRGLLLVGCFGTLALLSAPRAVALELIEDSQSAGPVQLAFATRMDYAHWHNEGTRFSCRLSQPIKRYGTAIFEQRAGYGSRFMLQAKRNQLQPGDAKLISKPPVWAPELPGRSLATVSVQSGKEAIVLDDQLANQMLAELQRGMAPGFMTRARYDDAEAIEVSLSSKHFLGAYDRFQECVDGLFAKNFEQLERTRVHFDTDKHSLNLATRTVLDEIIEYSKLDDSVRRIYIDGHTDDVHESSYNIGLSKRRAQAVSAYMATKGLSKKKLVTRYHGERYPVTENLDDDSRLQNRRVTVRLER